MKTICSFLMMAVFFAFTLVSAAQSSGSYSDNNCTQFTTVLDDAQNHFDEYAGEEIDMDYMLAYYEYNYNLWDDDGRECMFSIGGSGWVEFYYNSTYSLEEAKTLHAKLLQRVKDCLPGNYFISSTESEYSLVYYEFSDDRDKDNLKTPDYPQIEVTIEEDEDYYYVQITISTP